MAEKPNVRLLDIPRLSGAGSADQKAFLLNDYLFTLRDQLRVALVRALERIGALEDKAETAADERAANTGRLDDIAGLDKLTQSISSPPTQAEVQAVQDKVNAVIEQAKVDS